MSMPAVGIGRAWRRELARLAAWLTLCLLAGALLGYPLAAAFAGLALYLAVQLAYALKLHRWLVNDSRKQPEGFGVWQEIFLELYRLNQHNQKRKKRLKNILSEFQASTAALPDGAVVLDRNGCIVWFNQAAGAMLSLRSPQDLGQRIVNLVRHPRFAAYFASRDFQGREVEIPSLVHDQAVISLRLIPYGNHQRLLIARDISAQKRLEATRRDFVANASHELRTPLTVLRGYLDVMAAEVGEQERLKRWREPVREMTEQAMRMNRIIESLLELARVEAEGYQQKQEVVDVPAMIEHLVAEARRAGTKSHRLNAEVAPDLSLYGRAGELESVFSNLIANAVQYTPERGEISVRWWQDRYGVYFQVRDTGIGIEPKYIPRLTERFYRVDAARSSASGRTGLGLAIVKHCLEHHEAELEIISEPGAGSSFTCRFPSQRALLRQAGAAS